MARSNGAMGASVCGIMMMMMIMGAAAQAPAPSVDCPTVVFTLTDCLTYVTGTDKTPSATCCSELSSVINSTPQCLCLLFNTTFTEPLGVNITIAQQLPPACKLQTPPTSLCSAFGIPVPSPVSAVAPSPAKTPAAPTSPISAPASTPIAAGPMSSSPSPMIAPTGSVPTPAMSAPSLGPAGMPMVPSGTPPAGVSPTAPAPSSAPSITSRSAVVAASLLFLASIFLS